MALVITWRIASDVCVFRSHAPELFATLDTTSAMTAVITSMFLMPITRHSDCENLDCLPEESN